MVGKHVRKPLTYALMTSSLVITSGLLTLDDAYAVDVTTDLVATQTTGGDDIIVKPNGSIFVNAGTAVTIDSGNALVIEANNASGQPPGVSNNNASPTVNVTGAAAAGSGVFVDTGSGIINKSTGTAITVDLASAVGFTIDNVGTIQVSSTAADAINIANVDSPVIINRTGAEIIGGDDVIFFTDVVNIIIINEFGATMRETGTGVDDYIIEFNGSNSGLIQNLGTMTLNSPNGEAVIGTDSGGPNTLVITNDANATMTSKSRGIRLNSGANVIDITNGGTISAGMSGIEIGGTSNTGTILNQSTGVINAGTGAVEDSGILIVQPHIGNITNDGAITATLGGIDIRNVVTGDVTNNGTITATSTSTSGGIDIGPAAGAGKIVGNFINSSTGVISGVGVNQSGFYADSTNAIDGDFLNAGTISGESYGVYFGSNVTAGAGSGNVINTGTISQTSAAGADGFYLGPLNTIAGILNNQGTISSAATGATEYGVFLGGVVTGGFQNSGNVSGASGTAIRIESATHYTQTGGTITGDISTKASGGNLFLQGGTITGGVVFTADTNPTTVEVKNTTISGNIAGQAGTSNHILNVNGPFIHSANINNFQTLNVQNAGTYFQSSGVINMSNDSTLTIDADTLFLLQGTYNEGIGGVPNNAINVNGLFLVDEAGNINAPNSVLTVTGELGLADTAMAQVKSIALGAPAGTFGFQITDTTEFGQLQVVNGGDVTANTIETQITGDGLILSNDAFTVMNAGAALVGNGTVTIEQPNSQSVRFALSNIGANDVTLSAMRVPFQNIGQTESSVAVGTALDLLVEDPGLHPDLKVAIAQLDIQPTKDEVTRALESLTPDMNYGLVQVSQDIHNKIYDGIIGRINTAREFADIVDTIQSGDIPYYGFGGWAKAFASRSSQRNIDQAFGYTASGAGVTFGLDRMIHPELILGGAITYAMADVDGRRSANDEVDVSSLQLTGYASYDFPGAWYVDVLASVGLNDYKSKRSIDIGNLTRIARADYKAWQYSGMFQAGYNISYEKYRITPILGGRFGILDVDSYTESTAGGLNLAVDPKNVSEAVATFGVRFASLNRYVEALYVPELRILAHYDFIRDRQVSLSNFVSNGSIYFETRSFKPDPMTYNIGTSLTAYGDTLVFSINYDLEFKKQYLGHYGFIKLRYEW